MPYKIRLRRDTASAWTSANTTLGDGEAGYDSTNKRIKVGPGNWNDLSYVNGAGVTYNSTDNITSLAGTVEVGTSIVFEGATADVHETTLTVTDPTADRTITLPNASGDVALVAGSSGQVMFNSSGALAGDAGLTYSSGTDTLTVGTEVISGTFTASTKLAGPALEVTNQGLIKLFEGTAGGSEYVGLRANSTLANTNIYTMPTAVGTANQVLAIDTVTGTDATLKWATATGGSGSPGGSTTQVQFNDGGSFNGDAGLTYNASTDALTVGGALNANSVSTATITSAAASVSLYNASPVGTIDMGGSAGTVNIGNAVAGSTKNISIGTGGLGTTNITLGSTSGTCTINANGGTLVGNATTQNVFNATATTVNAFGAATAINIGNNDSEVNVGAATTTIRGGTLAGNLTTQNVFNATATTVNAFGAATALTLGATSGTATLRNAIFTLSNATTVNINGANPTLASTSTGTLTLFNTNLGTVNAFGAATTLSLASTATSNQTINLATSTVAGASAKDLNIGTNGAAFSATNINIGTGSSGTVTLNLGSATGSTTLNGAHFTLTNRGELRLRETGTNGSNYVGFKAADALAGNIVWELPAADGSANYVLSTNGSGVLSWVAQSGGGGSVATDTIWDAAGDLAIGDGSNTAVKLGRGSAGQVLTVNSAGTNIGWETPAPAVPDFVLYRLGIV